MATLYQRTNGRWVVAWPVAPSTPGGRKRQQQTFPNKSSAVDFMNTHGLSVGAIGKGRWRTPAEVLQLLAENTQQDADGCHVWTGAVLNGGYGRLIWTSPSGPRVNTAHRVAYHVLVGPVPSGLDLDHLCRNRRCINPSHLEPVTRQENIRRAALLKTRCAKGHPYDADNTYFSPSQPTVRLCRACKRDIQRARRAAQTQKAAVA